jgi:hypothetical protein
VIKKEEGRRKKEEGRGKKEEGRRKKEEGEEGAAAPAGAEGRRHKINGLDY